MSVELELLSKLTSVQRPQMPVVPPDVYLKVVCVDDTAPPGAREAFVTWARMKNSGGKSEFSSVALSLGCALCALCGIAYSVPTLPAKSKLA